MKPAALLLVVLMLGCATEEKYRAKVASWMNADAVTLLRTWGRPSSHYELPSGNTVVVYSFERRSEIPLVPLSSTTTTRRSGNSLVSTTTQSGGSTVEVYTFCITEFEITPPGKVVFWRVQGNACRSE